MASDRKAVAMTMSREDKMLFRKEQEEKREIRNKMEQAEKHERLLSEQRERSKREAREVRSSRNRELTCWGSLNLCNLDDDASDIGDIIQAVSHPFPLRTITTSYPEARSKTKIDMGASRTFRIDVLQKGSGPWSIGVVVEDSLPPGEYWSFGATADLVWYMNSRNGNMFNGSRLLSCKTFNDASRYFGPTGWTQGHEYSFNSAPSFALDEGDTLHVTVDLANEQGRITFRKNGFDFPNWCTRAHTNARARARARLHTGTSQH